MKRLWFLLSLLVAVAIIVPGTIGPPVMAIDASQAIVSDAQEVCIATQEEAGAIASNQREECVMLSTSAIETANYDNAAAHPSEVSEVASITDIATTTQHSEIIATIEIDFLNANYNIDGNCTAPEVAYHVIKPLYNSGNLVNGAVSLMAG